jgi:methyltransferase (TIGR00027 family)
MKSRRLDRRASFTAQSCAAQRAAETMQPPRRRLLDDPYSRHFVDDFFLRIWLIHPMAARMFIALQNYVFGAASHLFTVLRVRYVDEVCQQAIDSGIHQLVLLGAGFDTTALRRQLDEPVQLFEVDVPFTQADKRGVVDRLRIATEGVHWVPCDFERDVLWERLLANGFDPSRPSVIAWIGVTVYLTPVAIDATLSDLAALCTSGSVLLVDYVGATAESEGALGVLRSMGAAARRGEPFRTRFTSAEIDMLLSEHGFDSGLHLRAPELVQRYFPTHSRRSSGIGRLAITSATRI